MSAQLTQVQASIPAHVPAHLVQDFDIFFQSSPEEAFAKWRALHDEGRPEIFWTPRNGGHWVVTRADDIEAVYGNAELFTTTTVPGGNAIPFRSQPYAPLPINSDQPEHTEYWRLINPFFFPKRVTAVGNHARDLSNEILDKMIPTGGCEFYGEFAMAIPIFTFLALLGLPDEDWTLLMPLAQTVVREPDLVIAEKAATDACNYLKDRLEYRRTHPGDDPLTALVQGEVFGRKLTEDELVGISLNILFAGVDTTPATLSFVAHHLALDVELRHQLANDPSLIPAAVEEFLRRFPAPVTGRGVRHDVEYKGVTMKAGEPVLSPVILGNLDERRFPNPMKIDFGRKNISKTLSFGAGFHRCIGSMLGRIQLQVFLEQWLKRIPDYRLAEGDEPIVSCGTAMAITHLPLRW